MTSKRTHSRRSVLLTLLLWLIVLGLLGWVLRTVPLGEALRALGRLRLWQIAVLLIGNVGVVLVFAARWWLILRAQGFNNIPYLTLAAHRLAAFSVSYFTPGSQFGGEPLAVALLHRRHGVPLSTAAASVAVEKLLELAVNFSFLAMGVAVTLQGPAFRGTPRAGALAVSLALLSIPLAALLALRSGRRPASWLLHIMPARLHALDWFRRMLSGIAESEEQAAALLRDQPAAIGAALVASLLSWLAMIGEIWLSAVFLGVPLAVWELIAVITASRIAFLMPLPGGLGTLEASQVWIFGALGLDPALGLSLALIVRLRDVLFGAAGLLWGSSALGAAQQPDPSPND